MELPIYSKQINSNFIHKIASSLFQPFLQPAPIMEEGPQLMPLAKVQALLQQAYVKQEAISILIEYYDSSNKLQLTEQVVTVHSPVLASGLVKIATIDQALHLHINQIIQVTAITHELIA